MATKIAKIGYKNPQTNLDDEWMVTIMKVNEEGKLVEDNPMMISLKWKTSEDDYTKGDIVNLTNFGSYPYNNGLYEANSTLSLEYN